MRGLEDFIVTVPGLISPIVCAEIVKEWGWQAKRALVEGNKLHDDRNCDQVIVEPSTALDAACFKGLKVYRKVFPDCRVRKITNYVLVKYREGQFYKQHVDSFPDKPRLLTISIALNDDFEGGEWAWFDRGVTKRFKCGDAVLFPSNFMFPHEILPVTKGTRYALITWFTE